MAEKWPDCQSARGYTGRVGVRNSTYASWEKGEKDPSWIGVSAIVRATGCNSHWLLTGEGEMFAGEGGGRSGEAAPRPDSVAEAPHPAPDPKQEALCSLSRVREILEDLDLGLARREAAPSPVFKIVAGPVDKKTLREIETEGDVIRVVPILDGRIAAGQPRMVWEQERTGYAYCYAGAVPHPEATSCVRVAGDSMAPVIPSGALVAIDHTLRNPADMCTRRRKHPIAAVRGEDGGCVIRNISLYDHMLVCRPENPGDDHPELKFDLKIQDNPIIGQVIWWWVSEL